MLVGNRSKDEQRERRGEAENDGLSDDLVEFGPIPPFLLSISSFAHTFVTANLVRWL